MENCATWPLKNTQDVETFGRRTAQDPEARAALDALRSIAQKDEEQDGLENPRIQHALDVLSHEMTGQCPWEVLEEPLFGSPQLGEVLDEALLKLEYEEWASMDDDTPEGEESRATDHDPSYENESLVDNREAILVEPKLVKLLLELRELTSLYDCGSIQNCDFARDSATELLQAMEEETRAKLSELALKALTKQAELENSRRPRE